MYIFNLILYTEISKKMGHFINLKVFKNVYKEHSFLRCFGCFHYSPLTSDVTGFRGSLIQDNLFYPFIFTKKEIFFFAMNYKLVT